MTVDSSYNSVTGHFLLHIFFFQTNIFPSQSLPHLFSVLQDTLAPPCQGASETGNVSRPSAHGAPTDLQNRHSRGWVPAECLEQKMLYAYTTVCTQGDFTLSRK